MEDTNFMIPKSIRLLYYSNHQLPRIANKSAYREAVAFGYPIYNHPLKQIKIFAIPFDRCYY